MALKSSSDRYGTVAITIHWVTAAAIVALIVTGLMAAEQADPAAKLALLQAHLPLGTGVLALTLLRIVWWAVADKHPASVTGQSRGQELLAKLVHGGLYVIVLLMAASGIATIALSGALPAILQGTALPDFSTVGPRLVHDIGGKVTLLLFAGHVAAALWHQVIRRDRIMARMGVGR